jgi:transcriptional regulator with XRE-family HTH domain
MAALLYGVCIMRSTFGRYALKLRVSKGMSQKDFAAKVGMSISRVCNIEYQRVTVSDDVVGAYIAALNCNGEEVMELRKRAHFANSVKRGEQDGVKYPPLYAMFEQFSDRISPKAAAEIQRILERETGESIEALAFSSNRRLISKSGRQFKRPVPSPRRFAEICFLAIDVRNRVCREMEPLDIGRTLEILCAETDNLDYHVVETMPSYMDGAFACIIGEIDGHKILIEEDRFDKAISGVHFARHVVAHEIAHHFLHSDALVSRGVAFLPPQELAKNSVNTAGTDGQICQVVDTIFEAEAEIFATLLLVPWTAFIKGTELHYLAKDYGEQLDEIKRYAPYFKNSAVIDALKYALYSRGERKHPMFSFN